MNERPILFSSAMVRAILSGQKTQTRRIMKPQPTSPQCHYVDPYNGDYDAFTGWTADHRMCIGQEGNVKDTCHWRCPYGRPGERLWVRETHQIETWTYEYGNVPPVPPDRPWRKINEGEDYGERWEWPHYAATDDDPELVDEDMKPLGWRPSIFMPRWASRITLEICDVKAQRVQDISEEDALAEGCRGFRVDTGLPSGDMERFVTPEEEYRFLWDSINGKKPGHDWASNPFVWCISFRQVPQAVTP